MTTADTLTLITIFISATLGSVTLRFAMRADRRETAAEVAQRLLDAERRGRAEAIRDAQIADLQQQLANRPRQGDGPQ